MASGTKKTRDWRSAQPADFERLWLPGMKDGSKPPPSRWRQLALPLILTLLALLIGGVTGASLMLDYAQKRADEVVASKLAELAKEFQSYKQSESTNLIAEQAGKVKLQTAAQADWQPLRTALEAWSAATKNSLEEGIETPAERALKQAIDEHAAELERKLTVKEAVEMATGKKASKPPKDQQPSKKS